MLHRMRKWQITSVGGTKVGERKWHDSPEQKENIFKPELVETRRISAAGPSYFAVRAATGTSMSSLRWTRLVAFSVASSKPWPCVIASVGQASTQ